MIVAIDGPAGAGKSTVARRLARALGFVYLDTGAMYRAVAWALRKALPGAPDEAQIERALEDIPLDFAISGGELAICHRGEALNDELRDPEVTQMASRISQVQAVRTLLAQRQRQLADREDVVTEGRDVTTVVFPAARIKVYLTADMSTRAERRRLEYRGKGLDIDYALLFEQIRARDEADRQRSLSPLRPAADALYLDTSRMDPDEVVSRLLDFIRNTDSCETQEVKRLNLTL
jgi:CMP/dCMP kinase